jgi:surface antigen
MDLFMNMDNQTLLRLLFDFWYNNIYNKGDIDWSGNQDPKPDPEPSQPPPQRNDQCTREFPADDPCELASIRQRADFYTEVNRSKPDNQKGQCTEWVDGRYYQMFGVHFAFNGSAYTFADQARDDGNYDIDTSPSVGSVMVLPAHTLGSSSDGHVAIVEKVYDNGEICTSNWNAPDQGRLTMKKFRVDKDVMKFVRSKDSPALECN